MAKIRAYNTLTGRIENLWTWDERRREKKLYSMPHKFRYTKRQDQAVLRMSIGLIKLSLLLIATAWILGVLGIIK
uniref:Uncharacterized protein n=1 Tax=Caldisericum exile TaxID=693075 RepID=A0A7C4Y113_9BACT